MCFHGNINSILAEYQVLNRTLFINLKNYLGVILMISFFILGQSSLSSVLLSIDGRNADEVCRK